MEKLVEEIKGRIKILDLVYEFGLKVYRNNYIKSIYKDERTPSLKIYETTNTYKCYATGIQGDVIKFYMDYYRIDFKEALKELTGKAGIEKSRGSKSSVIGHQSIVIKKKEKKQKRRIERRVTILKSEREFFDERAGIYEYMTEMIKNKAEIKAMEDLMNERKEKQILIYESLEKYCYGIDDESFEYLISKERGLKPETIKRFRLFSIKDLSTTLEYLKECFSVDDLVIAGLLNKKGNFVFSYHKLIIPYIENNKITYLRGRTLQSTKGISKYISLNNFSGNLSLKRFFNLDVLKRVNPSEKLIVCEGEFDTMIMEQEGFKAVGIPGVTNIPEDQINLLNDYEVYAAFDNDEPGINAMQKLVKLINKPIKIIKLKHHKDLTELMNERSARNS